MDPSLTVLAHFGIFCRLCPLPGLNRAVQLTDNFESGRNPQTFCLGLMGCRGLGLGFRVVSASKRISF